MSLKHKTGKLLLKLFGWKIKGNKPQENSYIFAILPHTTYRDFLVGKMCNLYLDTPISFMIKKEAFFFPLGLLLRGLGGFPIDRKKPEATIKQIVHKFKEKKQFVLVIAPEGTRKKVTKWKSGFWFIASNANIPIVPVGLNYKTKTVYIDNPIYMTSNKEADFNNLRTIYGRMNLCGRHTDNFKL